MTFETQMMPSQPSSQHATIGILSIGEMGLGIAKLLITHNYRVITNIIGRSEETHRRAKEGNVELVSTDETLVQESDYILSILPPKDAFSTAQRIAEVFHANPDIKSTPLYFLDLNAISPKSACNNAALFDDIKNVTFIDGGIIGSPPRLKGDNLVASTTPEVTGDESETEWLRPSIPLSGPNRLAEAPVSGAHIAEVLWTRHISDDIGKASGLKMCFAATWKGYMAIMIQSFTAASQMGVLDELKKEMARMTPSALENAERGLPGIPPKSYRWIKEMEEIAATFYEEGGFEEDLFNGAAKVYRKMAQDTVLGEEKQGQRKRGTTADDVAKAMVEGIDLDDRAAFGKGHIEG